jgi:hypothetical protein
VLQSGEKELPMHRLIAALAVLASATVLAPSALADPPTREPLPQPPTFTITGSCAFDVQFDVLVNKEFITTFTSGRQIITGRLVVRLTNMSHPSKSLVLQINGPGINDLAAPSVLNLSGSSLIFFPGVLALTRGPTSLTFDEEGNVISFTRTSASSVDLCAVLADP